MRRPARKVLAAFAVAAAGLLCASDASRAAALDPTDHVAGHPGITYFDLVKQIVTDLDSLPAAGRAGAPTAHTIVPYRHIEGEDAKTVPAGPVAIQLLTAQAVRADGTSRLALLIDLGPSDGAVAEFTLLALFDMSDQPKLLDVVEVGTDRLTGFAGKPLPLGRGSKNTSDLITISSDHFNSNEDFVGTEFLFVRNDRFQLAGSLFTFDVRICASRRTEEPVITTADDPGKRYRQIHVAVNERVTLEPGRADCGGEKVPRPLRRTYQATYRWNAAQRRFEITSGDLGKLDRENKKLMSGGVVMQNNAGIDSDFG
jgi:hypothetical protein